MIEKPPKILIVDDIAENLYIVEHVLRRNNYDTVSANSGAKALQELERQTFDLILLDILMPDMDGFEVCARLQRNEMLREIPVIFLTALTDDDNILRGFEVGGVDYVTKPFRPAELVARVHTHVTLRQRETQLAAVNASKDKFISIISSELRQPFAALRGVLSVLKNDYAGMSDEDRQEYVDMSFHNADNLYKLINNLMTWSGLQRGVLPFRPTAIDLNAAVDDAVHHLADKINNKEILLAVEIPESAEVQADRDMLNSILRILISNSIMYNVERGRIRISAKDQQDIWQVEVMDSGIGIDEDDQKHLFRIDDDFRNRGTHGETGTGMGLILCKELVEKHGGEISLASTNGETCVTFTLPKFPE